MRFTPVSSMMPPMITLAVAFLGGLACSQDPPAKPEVRYGWMVLEPRADDHDVVIIVNGELFRKIGKPDVAGSILPSPLKEGANVVVVTFAVRAGRDLSKSKGSSLRLGLSPSATPGDGEVLELCDVVSRVAATECVLKFEMKKSSPGTCSGVERHWFDAGRTKPNEEFEVERDPVRGIVASTVHREWAENGKKKHEIRARSEKITSAEYYGPDGALGGSIKNGAGWARQYHDNGKVCQETPYRNGVVEGEEHDFDEAGRLQASTTYAGGKLHGPFRRYDEAGKLRIEGAYAEGEKDGPWIRRDEKGKETARSVFTRGKRTTGDDDFE